MQLKGEKYRTVRDYEDPLVQALIENYRIWAQTHQRVIESSLDAELQTLTLFDTVGVYLAISEELLMMTQLGIRVTNDGYTVVDENAKMVKCAIDWKDLPAFENFLVQRLTDTASLTLSEVRLHM